MAKKDDDLLVEEAFFDEEELLGEGATTGGGADGFDELEENNGEAEEAQPGQLAVDMYETDDKLFVKARTAGVSRSDLDVSISDNELTVSGILASGVDESGVMKWYNQECYWGEFSRTVPLPVPVKEEGVEAILKDGILTISFEKVRPVDNKKKIQVL